MGAASVTGAGVSAETGDGGGDSIQAPGGVGRESSEERVGDMTKELCW